jgi:hypothetical protein
LYESSSKILALIVKSKKLSEKSNEKEEKFWVLL